MAALHFTPPVRVVIASDAKRGHENQSRVIARMLGDAEPLLLHLRPRVSELPLRLRLALMGRGGMSQLRAAQIVRGSLQPERPEVFRNFAHDYRQAQGWLRLFTVSTGTAPATFNLILARMLHATSIVNMTPSLLPRRLFELNIVPEHDVKRMQHVPPNVITTPLALGYHDAQAAGALASRLARANGFDETGSYLGVCIGGPTQEIPYPAGWCHALLRQLLDAATRLGWRLLITTSRRTPERDNAVIAAAIKDQPQAAYFLDAHADPLNPLPAFYELSRAIIITADSYSMVSESIHGGHQPLVLVPPDAKRNAKVLHSLERLAANDMLWMNTDAARDDVGQLCAQLVAIPPRGQANALYEQLRGQVRAFLKLDDSA